MIINPYVFGGAPVGGALYDLIMADSPIHYWRNGEAVTTGGMIDEVNTEGTWVGDVSLGNAALYPGGPTTAGGNFGPSILGFSLEVPASLTAMTLVSIIRPTNLTGFKLIGVQRDENGGGRKWQWRSNGTAMEFVKIAGGVATVSQASMLAIDTTYLLGFEVDADGNYAMYRNGVAVKTGTIDAGDYGGAGDRFGLGYATGPATSLVGTTCENAVFDHVLGPTVHADLFAATGL